jgi:hypothetical protein
MFSERAHAGRTFIGESSPARRVSEMRQKYEMAGWHPAHKRQAFAELAGRIVRVHGDNGDGGAGLPYTLEGVVVGRLSQDEFLKHPDWQQGDVVTLVLTRCESPLTDAALGEFALATLSGVHRVEVVAPVEGSVA